MGYRRLSLADPSEAVLGIPELFWSNFFPFYTVFGDNFANQ